MVVTQRGTSRIAAVGDKHQVVLRKGDDPLLAMLQTYQTFGGFQAAVKREFHIRDRYAIPEPDTMVFQIFYQRQGQGFILIVLGKLEGGEIRQSANMMNETGNVPAHLCGAVPGLKGEHGLPIQPEVRVEEVLAEHIGNLHIVQGFLWSEEQLDNFHGGFFGQGKLAVRMGAFPAVNNGPFQRIVGILLVEPIALIQHRGVLYFKRGNGAEQIPEAFKVVFHFASAADNKAPGVIQNAVQSAAGELHLFQDADVFPFHPSVTHEKGCSRQGRETGADEISRLAVNTLRFFGTGKGFIISVAVIHGKNLLGIGKKSLQNIGPEVPDPCIS
ncbi:hypothetical protein D3C75_691220 [compost metagenome]